MFHLEVETNPIWEQTYLYNDVKKYMTEMGFIELYNIPQHHNGSQLDSVWKRKDNYL